MLTTPSPLRSPETVVSSTCTLPTLFDVLRNYPETRNLADETCVQDAQKGGQDGQNEAKGQRTADDLAMSR